MKNLVLVLDRLVSDGLWEFCLGDILNNYEGMVVNVMFARNATYRASVNPEDELLVVCESEEQAKKLAECLRVNLPREQFERVICLEGYEGAHYFENCVSSFQPLEKSLEQICDVIFKPAVINLDYCDFRQMTQGTENRMRSMRGTVEQVKKEWEQLLGEETINRCLMNLTGDVSIMIASDFMDTLSVCEDALIGVDLKEDGNGELEVMVIYR